MFHHWLMNRRKIIIMYTKKSMLLLNMNASIATKANTHYESLGIPVNATYEEIKSAYYKLTLQYHPDKNKSKLAKQRFHEISNAYDILSKYESRKQYDRTILVDNKNVNFIKQKTAPKSSTSYRGQAIYDFDKWLKMHYSLAFDNTMLHKQMKEEKESVQEDPTEQKIFIIFLVAMLVIFVIVIFCKNRQEAKQIEKNVRRP